MLDKPKRSGSCEDSPLSSIHLWLKILVRTAKTRIKSKNQKVKSAKNMTIKAPVVSKKNVGCGQRKWKPSRSSRMLRNNEVHRWRHWPVKRHCHRRIRQTGLHRSHPQLVQRTPPTSCCCWELLYVDTHTHATISHSVSYPHHVADGSQCSLSRA